MDDVQVIRDAEFETLFRREYPRLVAYGHGILGDLDAARDLAQETMARANSNWDVVSAADVPAAWLTRVMRNVVIDHQRRSQVEERAVRRLAQRRSNEAPAIAETPFHELVSGLPPRQREIATLRYVGDLSVDQIAEVLSVAPGTVKAHLWRARRAVGRSLESEREGEPT